MLEELPTNKLVFLEQSLSLYLLLMEAAEFPWVGDEILQLAAVFAHLGSRTGVCCTAQHRCDWMFLLFTAQDMLHSVFRNYHGFSC